MEDKEKLSKKRSKVSRACDCCRRKKVKCNASFSTSLNKITKKCDNCIKNQEECTFSRTPLKRGPSKGYIRDLEEKLESKIKDETPLTVNGVNGNGVNGNNGIINENPLNVNHITTPNTMNLHPMNNIVLPPITKTQSPFNNSILPPINPNSPNSDSNSPKIQGPFWKVPYELPSNNEYELSRRLSIDSISSNSTTGSKLSRLPSLKPSISNDQNSLISDSDDDYYSASLIKNSRRSSSASSPRNSISSLSSLNGRVKKINIQNSITSPNPSLGQLPHKHSNSLSSLNSINQTTLPSMISPPIHHIALESNLKAYYQRFHPNFPILPFSENLILQILDFKDTYLVELLNQSLNTLINYKSLNSNDCNEILNKFLKIYPFNYLINENYLIIFLSSLMLNNYAILLSGNNYSLLISITNSIFNDFKIMNNFKILTNKQNLHFDDFKLYLPKLYYCLSIIDNFFCLSFGTSKLISSDVNIEDLKYLVPSNFNKGEFNGYNYFKNIEFIQSLIVFRDKMFENNLLNNDYFSKLFLNCDNFNNYDKNGMDYQFSFIMKDKIELIKFLIEINLLFLNNNNNLNDEFSEILNDYILKLIRLIKNLSISILNFSKFISPKFELISPPLNLLTHQTLKLIKLSKLILDSLTHFINIDIFNRLLKINNDLSQSYQFILSNINYMNLSNTTISSVNDKINKFQINFNLNHNQQQDIRNWKFEFNSIWEFLNRDNGGWCI